MCAIHEVRDIRQALGEHHQGSYDRGLSGRRWSEALREPSWKGATSDPNE